MSWKTIQPGKNDLNSLFLIIYHLLLTCENEHEFYKRVIFFDELIQMETILHNWVKPDKDPVFEKKGGKPYWMRFLCSIFLNRSTNMRLVQL